MCCALAAWQGVADICVGPPSQLKERMQNSRAALSIAPRPGLLDCACLAAVLQLHNASSELQGVHFRASSGEGASFEVVGSCAALRHLCQTALCSTPRCELPCPAMYCRGVLSSAAHCKPALLASQVSALHPSLEALHRSSVPSATCLVVLLGCPLTSVALLTLVPCACLPTHSLTLPVCRPNQHVTYARLHLHLLTASPLVLPCKHLATRLFLCLPAAAQEQGVPPSSMACSTTPS